MRANWSRQNAAVFSSVVKWSLSSKLDAPQRKIASPAATVIAVNPPADVEPVRTLGHEYPNPASAESPGMSSVSHLAAGLDAAFSSWLLLNSERGNAVSGGVTAT